jgi:hypothetical protein
MSLKDIPVVTVEQIMRFREKAISIEQQRDKLLAICSGILENGIGASDLNSMRAIIAEIEATK